jgi:glutathione S-transferase
VDFEVGSRDTFVIPAQAAVEGSACGTKKGPLDMPTLCFAPGACSLAPHIVLEEGGQPFTLRRVNLAAGEQRTEAYKKIHPQGRVPALILDDGTVITENTAILPYLGKKFGLWPKSEIGEAKALSLIGLFAASVHPAWAHIARPGRYATDESAHPNLQATGITAFADYLRQIDAMLQGRDWLLDTYTVVDPYAFVFCTWAKRREKDFSLDGLRNLTAFYDRMMARPAVARTLASEKSVA